MAGVERRLSLIRTRGTIEPGILAELRLPQTWESPDDSERLPDAVAKWLLEGTGTSKILCSATFCREYSWSTTPSCRLRFWVKAL